MEHYNDVARTLMENPDRYSPLSRSPSVTTTCSGELWIEGFEKAVALRPAAWKTFLDADGDTVAAMSGMLMLAAIARGDEEVKDHDTASATAPDRIADWVVKLNEWRLPNYQTMQSIDPRGAQPPRKKSAEMIPVHVAQEENTRNCCGLN